MGTVLSLSPTSKKGAIMDSGTTGAVNNNKADKRIKRPSMFVSTLTWKKLVPNSAKKKSAKKVSPNPAPPGEEPAANEVSQLNHDNIKKSHEERRSKVPIPVPVPTVPTSQHLRSQTGGDVQIPSVQKPASGGSLLSPRRVVIQASTGELLRCLGVFMCRRCSKLKELTSGEVILWFRNIDRTLLMQGWQDQGFITPANLVFVYLLCQDSVTEDIDSAYELQGTFLTCLYLAYSYMGNEISYPLKPFMIDANKDEFWEKSLGIINRMSHKMLLLNSDPHFFTEVFQELKDQRPDGDANLDR
ncbi:hypothetical protein NHX12_017810 [Muraenolepis orangiensis]|uniref:Cyclin-dependent kinase 5 activator n=1 Tax=Muraenolepis orangiensis TaxID=630683 RepID=A0A9Q0EYK1_9TELE|nr:hypothetical protein NHX12_017810 [Muraenolepis orangiensis]